MSELQGRAALARSPVAFVADSPPGERASAARPYGRNYEPSTDAFTNREVQNDPYSYNPPGMWKLTLLSLLLLVVSCRRFEVSADEWKRMSVDDRELVVRSFVGGEQAAHAKGRSGRRTPHPPEHYIREIDRRIAAGDERPIQQIWAELAADGPSMPANQ